MSDFRNQKLAEIRDEKEACQKSSVIQLESAPRQAKESY